MKKEHKRAVKKHNKIKEVKLRELDKFIESIQEENEELRDRVVIGVLELYLLHGAWDIQKLRGDLDKLRDDITKDIIKTKVEEEERIINYLLDAGIKEGEEKREEEKKRKRKEEKEEKDKIMKIIISSWAGLTIGKRMKRNRETLTTNVRKQLVKTAVVKTELSEVLEGIEKEFNKVEGMTSMLINTEVSRVEYEVGMDELLDRKGQDTVLIYNATFDNTCSECESNHGTVYELGEELQLPIHPNCRCFYTPYDRGREGQ